MCGSVIYSTSDRMVRSTRRGRGQRVVHLRVGGTKRQRFRKCAAELPPRGRRPKQCFCSTNKIVFSLFVFLRKHENTTFCVHALRRE